MDPMGWDVARDPYRVRYVERESMSPETTTKQAENVAVVNPASASKINIASAISLLAAVAASAGVVIPPQWQELALQITSIVTPILIVILRTWFTTKTPSVRVLQTALIIKKADDAQPRPDA